jgi:succinate-acetate transporter protein
MGIGHSGVGCGKHLPMVAFGSFGGFWTSYAILIQPSFRVAAGFAPSNVTDNTFAGVQAAAAGASTRAYNSGVGLYFVTWAIVNLIYTIAATRTNVMFFLVFLTLTFAFSLLAAAHFHTGLGEMTKAANEFKAGGAFAFVTSVAGFWIAVSLILKSVDFPYEVPVFDLSGLRFMQPRRRTTDVKDRTD